MLFNKDLIKQLRKDLKLTQKDLSEVLDVSRGYIAKLETGKNDVTEDIDKKLQQFENDARKKLSLMSVKNRELRDSYYLKTVERQEEIKILHDNIKKLRKAQDFNPSFEGSVDKIWLSATLDRYKRDMFEYDWLSIGRNSKKLDDIDLSIDVKDLKYATWQNGRYRGVVHCLDGVIHFEYLFKDNQTQEDYPKLKVSFNPNKVKWDNKYLLDLMFFLGEDPLTRKVDVCVDYVGTQLKYSVATDLGMRGLTTYRSRKSGSITHQFGDMNKNGTRIYDKRGEALDEDGKDIGYECTRIETRVSLSKSVPISQLEGVGLTTQYPSMSLMDVGYTKESLGVDVDGVIFSCLQSITRGDSLLDDYKARPRDYKKLKALIDNIKTVRICLTHDDVKLAFLRFKMDYEQAYYLRYKPLSSGDTSLNCISNF